MIDQVRRIFYGGRRSGKMAAITRQMLREQYAKLVNENPITFDEASRFVNGSWDVLTGQPMMTSTGIEPDRKAIPRFGVALVDPADADHLLAQEAESLLGYSAFRQKLKLAGRLGEILAQLEIQPLDAAAVEKYKAEMVAFHLQHRTEQLMQKASLFQGRWVVNVRWESTTLTGYDKEIPTFVLRKALEVKKACPEVSFTVDELICEKKLVDPFLVATVADEQYFLEVWGEPKFEATL